MFAEFFSQFTGFFNTILAMFMLLIIGFIAGKANIIDSVASKKLSALIIKVAQPALIIGSLIKMEYSRENLMLGLKTLGFGFVVHGVLAVIAYIACVRFKNINERKLTEFATIFGNVGFLGIPVLRSLLGDTGAFMAAFFIVSFNIVLWTWGIAIMARQRDDIKLTPQKLINFGTVPCTIGFLLFVFMKPFFDLPSFVMTGLDYTASLCTPISMLIIGALLSTRTLRQIFASGKIYFLCFLKLLLTPILVATAMKFMGFSQLWIFFGATVVAMPTATTETMLAELYDIEPGYSAQAVGTTSLFSVLTMPIVIFYVQTVLLPL